MANVASRISLLVGSRKRRLLAVLGNHQFRETTFAGHSSSCGSGVHTTARRPYSSLFLSSQPLLLPTLRSSLSSPLWDPQIQIQQQQIRWKRRDGNKAFDRERKPNKKQLKQYRRELGAAQREKDKHGAPGSKAGPRREWYQKAKEDLLNPSKEIMVNDDYDMGDVLLDDLMGNTKGLSSQPNIRPVYLGHLHHKYYAALADQMEDYYQSQNQIVSQQPDATTKETAITEVRLPTDKEISLVVRAYRDKQGTRQKPIGLIKALQHVLTDLRIPIAAFGEYTYTSLLTCCRTPAEGRRVMQLQRQNQQPITSYSWSILVDIHSKVGDFEGCSATLDEMVQTGNVQPTLPAYTSLLAACYKVCHDGRIAHSIRARAGELAWKRWQEMRIVGLDPDVMAYGAMLRICAARGHGERAINILEEMQQFDVKPTTLCFSSALRAVARSHAIACRYERGTSRFNRRREFLTQHHGKMARTIVIMAESAEVKQDAAFVSALILCAATAGDVATAKAIYVASQIRRMDELRTIGSNEHLARLRGDSKAYNSNFDDDEQQRLLSLGAGGDMDSASLVVNNAAGLSEMQSQEGNDALTNTSRRRHRQRKYPSYERREYGKDSRVLSGILHACAIAADQDGMGTLWQGRENKGYLCENSLRLLSARRVPNYVNKEIPGQGRTDSLTWDGENEDHRSNFDKDKKYRKSTPKFRGVYEDQNTAANLDELEDTFYRMFVNEEDGTIKKEFRPSTFEDIWKLKYGDDLDDSHDGELALTAGMSPQKESSQSIEALPSSNLVFNVQKMKWETIDPNQNDLQAAVLVNETTSKTLSSPEPSFSNHNDEEAPTEMYFDVAAGRWKEGRPESSTSVGKSSTADALKVDLPVKEEVATEMYFDDTERRWKTRTVEEGEAARRTAFEREVLASKVVKEDVPASINEEESFQKFFAELVEEAKESGEGEVLEDEARELYFLMKDEYNEVMSMKMEDLEKVLNLSSDEGGDEGDEDDWIPSEQTVAAGTSSLSSGVEISMDRRTAGDNESSGSGSFDATIHEQAARDGSPSAVTSGRPVRTVEMDDTFWSKVTNEFDMTLGKDVYDSPTDIIEQECAREDDGLFESDYQLYLLREALPTFSEKRLRRIKSAFQRSLGDPSLLELVPLVRERLPDYITNTWLKQMGALTSRFVMYKAVQDDLVDIHILNGALELEAASGSLDRAIEFYETQFGRHGLEPNGYSDRMMVQMFLKNNRLSRALALKQKLESAGKTLDIPSYGSLIDFCSRRGQLGSALMFLKECISVHNAAPGEASISQLRILCRQADVTDEVGLVEMVGEDPVQWLREGEAHLKREYSKKGRRNVQIARNRSVQI